MCLQLLDNETKYKISRQKNDINCTVATAESCLFVCPVNSTFIERNEDIVFQMDLLMKVSPRLS